MSAVETYHRLVREAAEQRAHETEAFRNIASRAIQKVGPYYQGRLAGPLALDQFRAELRQRIDCFWTGRSYTIDLRVTFTAAGEGHLIVTPELDPAPESPELVTARALALAAVTPEPDPPPQRMERAKVGRVGLFGQPAVDIAGALEDLRDWKVPPDVRNGAAYGYQRALEDFRGYLEARMKEGNR